MKAIVIILKILCLFKIRNEGNMKFLNIAHLLLTSKIIPATTQGGLL